MDRTSPTGGHTHERSRHAIATTETPDPPAQVDVVRLGPAARGTGPATVKGPDLAHELAHELARRPPLGDGLDSALDLAARWGGRLPRPGSGRTAELWELLATAGAADLQVARVLEPHLDALAILGEAGETGDAGDPSPSEATWGVYAAEGPGVRLVARHDPDPGSSGQQWSLDGVKPWCSLADRVSHALVTAWVGEDRGLFRVALRRPGVTSDADPWVARGLPGIRSTSLRFEQVAATPVGAPGWYLTRDGFAWGGMGVAAVWYGGAVGLLRRLRRQAATREPDQIGLAHLGAVDAALHAARAVLGEAAASVDAGRARGEEGALLALRVRQVVADAAESVLRHADHALGPGPLVQEEAHAARVADLHLYLRQHHAERDAAALGRRLLPDGEPW